MKFVISINTICLLVLLLIVKTLNAQERSNTASQLIYEEQGKESAYPRLSKDGTKILFQSNRTGRWQLYLYEMHNKELSRFSNDSFNDNFPDWSPDNRWITFVSDREGNEEIYLAKADGSETKRITNDKARDIHPYFSPDGKYILFNSTRGNGSLDIYRFTISSSAIEQLTNTTEDETCARYSPDMKQIVFLKNDNSTDDIFTLNPTSGLIENISKTPAIRDGWPMFSPDGKSIYFSSMETENFGIYTMKTDGTEKKQLTFPERGEDDERVNISRDGKFFIYNKRYGSTISIMRSE